MFDVVCRINKKPDETDEYNQIENINFILCHSRPVAMVYVFCRLAVHLEKTFYISFIGSHIFFLYFCA